MLPPFDLHRPTSVAAAVALLDEDHLGYWGGTELLIAMTMGLLAPAGLVDLKRIPELREIRDDGTRVVIGAGVTHDELATSPIITSAVPLLADVESRVGNARVRAQGTIGGNLCFGEPRSDVATALLALDAEVGLESRSGRRTVPIAEFVLGPYWTAREPDELLVEISIPQPAAPGVYLKFQVTERPTVGVAALVVPSTGRCRVVVGAVAEIPMVFDHDSWAAVDPSAIAGRLEPIGDLTGSVEYKQHVTAVFVARAVRAAQQEVEQ
ncbi:MAG TPA: FAD binding domain-containing protein [Jatrophihabitans sp.]|nr:FAD binding domain-containing protein [Jatrophihabitans sp.]